VSVTVDATAFRERIVEEATRVVSEHPPAADLRSYLTACFEAGLAWVRFPEGMGGMGAPAALQPLADGVLQAAGAPVPYDLNPMGYGMAGPTLVEHAPHLAREMLRPLFLCDEIWCQLFSEPGAGSDLAGLATRAVRDGSGWRVTGQKVWTSSAHLADRALLLARTDPTAVKHSGLTYFVLDMHDPGVEVRPLRQITGDAEFNEVYLDGAFIPDDHRIGPEGAGWGVAMTTLMNERNAIGGGATTRGSGAIGSALDLWRTRPDLQTAVLEDRLVDLFARSEAIRLTGQRLQEGRGSGPAGPEGSVAKLVTAELNQDVYELCMDMLAVESTLYDSYDLAPADVGPQDDIQRLFLRSRANTIEGGTSEVLRTVIGERLLGLPREVRVDTGKPWQDVPRG
jgi:alkylation response protein AidB-like acyl-CoA dehydrogenase